MFSVENSINLFQVPPFSYHLIVIHFLRKAFRSGWKNLIDPKPAYLSSNSLMAQYQTV